VRKDTKLSDRSISGTFVGISDKGNGYIFLIEKSNTLVEIDRRDAKFNETFADYRERKGILTAASYIKPDLRTTNENLDNETHNKRDMDKSNNDNEYDTNGDENGDSDNERHQHERQRRQTTPRQFLLPGTHSKKEIRSLLPDTHSKKEIEIRKQQYSNLCLDNVMEDHLTRRLYY
jgi:hypothetical protein